MKSSSPDGQHEQAICMSRQFASRRGMPLFNAAANLCPFSFPKSLSISTDFDDDEDEDEDDDDRGAEEKVEKEKEGNELAAPSASGQTAQSGAGEESLLKSQTKEGALAAAASASLHAPAAFDELDDSYDNVDEEELRNMQYGLQAFVPSLDTSAAQSLNHSAAPAPPVASPNTLKLHVAHHSPGKAAPALSASPANKDPRSWSPADIANLGKGLSVAPEQTPLKAPKRVSFAEGTKPGAAVRAASSTTAAAVAAAVKERVPQAPRTDTTPALSATVVERTPSARQTSKKVLRAQLEHRAVSWKSGFEGRWGNNLFAELQELHCGAVGRQEKDNEFLEQQNPFFFFFACRCKPVTLSYSGNFSSRALAMRMRMKKRSTTKKKSRGPLMMHMRTKPSRRSTMTKMKMRRRKFLKFKAAAAINALRQPRQVSSTLMWWSEQHRSLPRVQHNSRQPRPRSHRSSCSNNWQNQNSKSEVVGTLIEIVGE